ncbi:MAG: hypothetical protein KF716_24755 [Anaerolineae bacterium]|nr:hypothetical protein [Anaerolineae bacterium]
MPTRSDRTSLFIGLGIALVQIVDIILHVATNQAEPIRITSNLAVLVWLAFLAFGKFKQGFRLMTVGFIGVYLALNIAFLAMSGLTNAAQGGGLRVTLLVLIALTVILAALLAYFWERHPNNSMMA